MNGKLFGRIGKALQLLLLLLILGSVLVPGALPYQFVAVALADDDDDGDDNDDDGGGRGYESSSPPPAMRAVRPPRILRQLIRPFSGRQPAPPRRAAPAAPEPRHAERQIVAMGLSDENLSALEAGGYVVLDQTALPIVGQSIIKLQVPAGTDLEAARQAVRELNPDGRADFNHYYRPGQGEGDASTCSDGTCWASALVQWPHHTVGAPASCNASVRIGMIDTGINPDHETFADSKLEVKRLGNEQEPASGRQHGTAVAALLVGSSSSRTPGLLPDAELFAVDAFQRANSGSDRAEAFDLVVAIDHLLAQQVAVINMSLAGDANDLLRRSIETGITDHAVIFIAAVGNDGPRAEPVYPAAYPDVIAVTAIDRRKRPYRRAAQGEHVDIASPGVEVWTAASIRGARPKTGTSFAAPFVTAVAALMKAADPALKPGEVEQQLAAAAEDLGEFGKDDIFGWGLLNASTACGPRSEAEPVVIE